VVVTDEWRVVDKRGSHATYHPFLVRTPEDHAIATSWCDQQAPHDAPHRVVRVALVEDANHSAPLNSSPRVMVTEADAGGVTDTQRLDALERGDIEIECMGTTVRYFNVLSRTGRMVTASPVDANPLTLREAITAALTEAPADGA
jgi:hypothetical protein